MDYFSQLRCKGISRVALWLLLSAMVAGGCRVSLVPDADNSIQKQIIDGAKATDLLYLEMLDAPKGSPRRSYDACAPGYRNIEASIRSIVLQTEARPKGKSLLPIAGNVLSSFVRYKEEHRTAGTLTDGAIKLYRTYMADLWRPLLIVERGLPKPSSGSAPPAR